MSIYRILLGKTGEEDAVKFLIQSDYKILARNYRTKQGEIDIIARDKDTLVFIEVKNRKNIRFGVPEEAVDKRKQNQIGKVAVQYLCENKLFSIPCRFDVVVINDSEQNIKKEIKLIKNAFFINKFLPI